MTAELVDLCYRNLPAGAMQVCLPLTSVLWDHVHRMRLIEGSIFNRREVFTYGVYSPNVTFH